MTLLIPELVWRNGTFEAGTAVEIAEDGGRIAVVRDASEARGDGVTRLRGRALLPGFVNAHSHAFQRLIRGRTQWRRAAGAAEDFWSWRSAMYEAALTLDADDVEAVARFCFVEMLRAGYTSVGEFHYLHADPRGAPYADGNELAKRVIAAAEDVGIRIRLIDAAYATGGIGEPLRPQQRRFATPELERWLEQVARLHAWAAGRPLASVGVAAHSVRAVPADWLAPIHGFARAHELPFHGHASEQPAEVVACEAAYGLRPIELLAEHGVLDGRTTVVHATHISAREVSLLGVAATVCACPTTERDLGDGLLQAEALVSAGARIAIGSDSQTVIDPLEEIRLIEYHERLRSLRRVVLAEARGDGRADVAPRLLSMGTVAGARSLRLEVGDIAEGALADLVAIDLEHPSLEGWSTDSLPALLALSAPADVITDVWVGGVQRITARRHVADESAAAGFRARARRLA